uniref:Activin_recp domain-containing protein n=1 Tax=Steinernema glaseri TaxID=37863 RepID=A0A1I8ABG7_9BILA
MLSLPAQFLTSFTATTYIVSFIRNIRNSPFYQALLWLRPGRMYIYSASNMQERRRRKRESWSEFNARRGYEPGMDLIVLFLKCQTICSLLAAVLSEPYKSPVQVSKIRCYQCNQAKECSSGICYGDVCVKSANFGYVSKGCQNRTGNVYTRSVSSDMIESASAELMQIQEVRCESEVLLGIETKVCYCNDKDFCNAVPSPLSSALVPPLVMTSALLLLWRL